MEPERHRGAKWGVLREHWFLLFFVLYAVVVSVKLWGLFSNSGILPGGDTSSHYLALEKFTEGLSHGNFSTYFSGWFGGEPLFQFYAPLPSIVMGGFYFLFGKVVGLAIIFRWFIFLSLLVFPLAFKDFLKEFFGESIARWGVWFSFLWVFYPKIISSIGAGAGGAIFYGLFSQVAAVSLFLWYLILLSRFFEEGGPRIKEILKLGLVGAIIVLTHTVTAIAMVLTTAIFGVYHWRKVFKKQMVLSFCAAVLTAFLVSAFWLIPFIKNIGYTSAERIDFKGYISSALNPFLHFDVSQGIQDPINFDYAWFITLGLFIAGFRVLIRDQKYLIPITFGVLFVVFNLDYINQTVSPFLPIHYYRFVAYEILFYLAIAGVGLSWVGERAFRGRRLEQVSLAFIALSFVHYVFMFNLSGKENDFNIKPHLSGVASDFIYEWRNEDFKLAKDGEAAIRFLGSNDVPEKPIRTLSDINVFTMVENLGTIHYFNAGLPLENNQSVIAGLFAESSWQLPFIFPTTNAITGNNVTWGRVRELYNNGYFNSQDVESMVERLRVFGVNYLVMTSNSFEKRFPSGVDGIEFIKAFGPIRIYHITKARPSIYLPSYMPGLFVGSGVEGFREFALGWYSEPSLLTTPIAWQRDGVASVTKENTKPFGFIVVSGDPQKLSQSNFEKLESVGKPVLFVHDGDQIGSLYGKSVEEISNFQPTGKYGGRFVLFKQPNVRGLHELRDFVLLHREENHQSSTPVSVNLESDNNLRFTASGPVIVNLSYFPYWHRTDGEMVYPVTPGQMLVFASGTVGMEYGGDGVAKASGFISVLSILGVLGWLGVSAWKKKHVNASQGL